MNGFIDCVLNVDAVCDRRKLLPAGNSELFQRQTVERDVTGKGGFAPGFSLPPARPAALFALSELRFVTTPLPSLYA